MNANKIFEILLVDDDVDLTNLLKKQIEGSGYKCHTAISIEEAQSFLNKNIPHVIILDINLGEQKSWPIIPWIREKSQFSQTKLFLASKEISQKTILQAKSFGVDELLAKPLQAVALVQKLKKTLRNSETLTYQFKKDTLVNCELYATHPKINEVSFILVSPVKFAANADVTVESELFKELGVNSLKMRTVNNSKPLSAGSYGTEVTFRGMNEKMAQKIRKIKLK